MNVLKKFIELTEYIHAYGYEHEMEHLLPQGISKDEVGNYYLEIGESNTLFTAHLDTVSYANIERVNHIVYKENNRKHIKSDGSSILGADNRSGVLVLLYMIEQQVPGLYYFFIGEEEGRIGSSKIADMKPTFFKRYENCVSFDRKGYGSVVSHQCDELCCSPAFVGAVSSQLSEFTGFDHYNDDLGCFTDSYSFKHLIPNCTNISVGYFNAHTNDEYQDISYLMALCDAVCLIDWENLVEKSTNRAA